MDYLEKYEAEQEERQEAIASTATVRSAALADKNKPRTDICAEDYPVTVIGMRPRDRRLVSRGIR